MHFETAANLNCTNVIRAYLLIFVHFISVNDVICVHLRSSFQLY